MRFSRASGVSAVARVLVRIRPRSSGAMPPQHRQRDVSSHREPAHHGAVDAEHPEQRQRGRRRTDRWSTARHRGIAEAAQVGSDAACLRGQSAQLRRPERAVVRPPMNEEQRPCRCPTPRRRARARLAAWRSSQRALVAVFRPVRKQRRAIPRERAPACPLRSTATNTIDACAATSGAVAPSARPASRCSSCSGRRAARCESRDPRPAATARSSRCRRAARPTTTGTCAKSRTRRPPRARATPTAPARESRASWHGSHARACRSRRDRCGTPLPAARRPSD